MSDLRIRALDELGDGFRALAREDRARPRSRSRRRTALVAVAATLVLSAGAGAAVIALQEGDPIPEPRITEVPPELRGDPRSQRLAAVRVADPASGPEWSLRLLAGEGGRVCATVGQVVNGRLGLVRDATFRELPAREADTCLEPDGRQPLTMSRRSFLAPGEEQRTAVFGLATEAVDRVELTADGETTVARPGADGAYLAVYAGDVNPVRTVVYDDGHKDIFDPRP